MRNARSNLFRFLKFKEKDGQRKALASKSKNIETKKYKTAMRIFINLPLSRVWILFLKTNIQITTNDPKKNSIHQRHYHSFCISRQISNSGSAKSRA